MFVSLTFLVSVKKLIFRFLQIKPFIAKFYNKSQIAVFFHQFHRKCSLIMMHLLDEIVRYHGRVPQ